MIIKDFSNNNYKVAFYWAHRLWLFSIIHNFDFARFLFFYLLIKNYYNICLRFGQIVLFLQRFFNLIIYFFNNFIILYNSFY